MTQRDMDLEGARMSVPGELEPMNRTQRNLERNDVGGAFCA